MRMRHAGHVERALAHTSIVRGISQRPFLTDAMLH